MFLSVEDTSDKKLVLFYCTYTGIYCFLLLVILYLTDNLFRIGKYDFFPVIVGIVCLEILKYVVGNKYYRKIPPPILGRSEPQKKNSQKKSVSRDMFKSCGLIVAMLLIYYVLAVLFGAQIFTKQEETFMLSLLISILTILPACINVGPNSVMLLLFGIKPSSDLMCTWLLRTIQLTLFGTWLGAFVIPLDWDRPWQEWPISCACGALCGFMSASLLMIGLIYSLQYHTRKMSRRAR